MCNILDMSQVGNQKRQSTKKLRLAPSARLLIRSLCSSTAICDGYKALTNARVSLPCFQAEYVEVARLARNENFKFLQFHLVFFLLKFY